MKRLMLCGAIVILAICLAAPVMAATVAQGKCKTYDKDNKTIVIEEYNMDFSKDKYGQPTGKDLTFDVSEALIGRNPEPGNVLRVAYDKKGDKNMAIRIMNITKTDLMKK